MPLTKRFKSDLPRPSVSEPTHQGLCLESTLGDLSLHHFQVEAHHLGGDIVQWLERYPLLPGIVLVEQRQLLGIISRQRLLEFLIRPQGLELVMSQPLSVIHSYARMDVLLLPDTTPIPTAAQLALRRSPEQQSEPLLVQTDRQTYKLLSIHELNIAYWQIRGIETQARYERTQLQMIQSEKMASLGRLVDGVAHEILDPVSFIWGNLTHVSTYVDQILKLVAAYENYLPEAPDTITELNTEIELDYLRRDLPCTISSIQAGADRLKKLATSLQNFCHIDDVYPKPADLHECLDSILLLLKSRLSGDIQIVRNYGHLPPVSCYAGQLNQVFMNILTNAIDALINQTLQHKLADELGGQRDAGNDLMPTPRPKIMITTEVQSRNLSAPDLPAQDCRTTMSTARWVSIRIADNGPGLSAEMRQQILESFSVERRAAKETSLAVSYQIVTAKHGGKLFLRSPSSLGIEELERTARPSNAATGTEFEILLPLM